jgi:hypothetical protein
MKEYEFRYTEEHQQILTEYLSKRQNALNVAQVSGYLFAQVCSPDALEVEQWIATITSHDEALAEDVMFAFMALHHDISERVYAGHYTLDWDKNSSYTYRQHWSQGFVIGVEPYYEKLCQAQTIPDELKQALQMATEQLSFFSLAESQVKEYCQKTGVTPMVFIEQQTDLANEFANGYAQLIEATALSSGLYDNESGF